MEFANILSLALCTFLAMLSEKVTADPLQVVDEYLPNVDRPLEPFEPANALDAYSAYEHLDVPEGAPRLLRHAGSLEEPGDGTPLNGWHGFLMRPSPTHEKRVSEREISSLLKNTWVG